MPIDFACTCGKPYQVPDAYAGKKAVCPDCKAKIVVPVASVVSLQSYASTNSKYCHYCGQTIALRAEICPKCGVRQTGSRGEETGSNRVVACLLAIFLGNFGAHKFYLGHRTMGIIYLLLNLALALPTLFVGPLILWVICLIEGLTYLSYSDEAFAAKFVRI